MSCDWVTCPSVRRFKPGGSKGEGRVSGFTGTVPLYFVTSKFSPAISSPAANNYQLKGS